MAGRPLAALTFCALLFASTALGQTSVDFTLRVRVADPAGLAVTGARVIVRNILTGQTTEVRTDEQGLAEFANPSKGRYTIHVSAEGLADDSRVLEWEGRESTTVDMRLAIAGIRQQVTVSSGSRVEELREESPVKVEAITRDQMLTTGYERVTDILSEIPGVVTRSGSTATAGAEQIHGIDSRQVAVLQDGLPLVGARGIKRGNLNLNRQSVGRLERIEVVKGAASSLFGSDAIGGVINMISREPVEPLEANLNLSGGSLGSFDGRGDFGTRWRNLTLFLDLEHHRQNSYVLVPGSTFTVGPDWRRNDLLFKSRYSFTPRAAVSFSANAYHNREEGRSAGETGPTQGLYNDSTQNYTIAGDFLPTNSTTLQIRAYSARYDENSRLDSIGPPAPPAFANLNQRYQRLDATVGQQIGTRNFLQAGYEWVQDNYKGANRLVGDNAGRQITANDVWLQDRVQLTRFATVTLGGRVTSHSLFGSYAVPKAGLVVRLNDNWSVRGSFGLGFRAPDLGQLYYRFANPASFYQVIGNPNLEPETSRSFSAGAVYRHRRLRLGASLFRNDVRNLIDSFVAGTPRTAAEMRSLLAAYGIPSSFEPLLNRQTFVYINVGRIYTRGFELDAEHSLTRSLRLQGAYTFLDAIDKNTRLRLPQRHRHQGYVRTEYMNQRLGLLANLRGTFFSRWLLNPAANTSAFGYSMWDFYLSKNLPRGVQFYFAVDNLANSRDQKLELATPTFDRPDYGRQYRVGMRLRLNKGE